MRKIFLLNLIVGLNQASGNLTNSIFAAKLIHSPADGLLHNIIEYKTICTSYYHFVVMPKSHFFPGGLDNRSKCWQEELFGLSAMLSQSYLSIKN